MNTQTILGKGQPGAIVHTIRNNCTEVGVKCCPNHKGSKKSKEQSKWERRAQSKALTTTVMVQLNYYLEHQERIDPINKPEYKRWRKRYNHSFFCCHYIEQDGDGIVTDRFCRQRWCATCSRIRAANSIKGYGQTLEELPDLHFVTLTIRNCTGDNLRLKLDGMQKAWRKIYRKIRDEGYKPQGYKKMEVTYNPAKNTYHPHYHFVISGQDAADRMQSLWMEHYGNDAGQGGQYVTKVTDERKKGSIIELMKYCHKVLEQGKVHPAALHTIHKALLNRRTFGAFGIKKLQDINVEPEEVETSQVDWLPKRITLYIWNQDERTWNNGKRQSFVQWTNPRTERTIQENETAQYYETG